MDGTVPQSERAAPLFGDVAATRLLSDLLWFMHMMAPILVLTTNREPGDMLWTKRASSPERFPGPRLGGFPNPGLSREAPPLVD